MINESDIRSEEWRKYVWPDGREYFIDVPSKLYVKTREDGTKSHRVVSLVGDGETVTHYITDGWIAIQWSADPEVSF